MELKDMISYSRGDKKADLLLVNARIVNVFSGQIVSGHVGIAGGVVLGTGDYEAEKAVDLAGKFLAPGFIDPHVHIESAMASVTEFARAVLCCGTTTVVADPHEMANVLGKAGIEYMLDAAEHQPMNIYYTLPSCVPATHMETSGARLDADDLGVFMGKEKILGLAEVMNYPGVIYGDPDVLKKIELARTFAKRIEGHAPNVKGKALNAYVSAGISSDHECTVLSEAMEKLNAGMHIMVREGTGAKNLEDLVPLINSCTSQRMMWCTDDRHPHDILDQGHILHIVRKAIRLGLDPVMAIQMGTLNPARYFGLRHLGGIGPGRQADLVVFSDLDAPRAEQVYTQGKLAAEHGEMVREATRPDPVAPPRSMNLDVDAIDFSIPAKGRQARVIEVIPGQIFTRQQVMAVKTAENMAVADITRDILKLAVVDRYSGKGGTGKGFVAGFGISKGALAASVAHDSHNIIVVGTNDGDMKMALDAVVRMGGGLTAVCDGRVLAGLSLPIAGLMSFQPVKQVREELDHLLAAARKLGTTLADPFMALSFLALPVIPELKLTDKGLVDVEKFQIVPLFVES